MDTTDNRKRILIYQVMTRLFGNTNTTNRPWGTAADNGVGKFNDFTPKALAEIKVMGFTHIWYTGVIEHASLTDLTEEGIPLDHAGVVKGRAGSPYAIKDYYDVTPDLAVSIPDRMREFEALIRRTHEAGLKIFIDFVPNHVARLYKSDAKPDGVKDFGEEDDRGVFFHPHNNFYYLREAFQMPEGHRVRDGNSLPTEGGLFNENPAKATGNNVFSSYPSVHDWFDTVKLNYGVDYSDNRKTHFRPIPDTWLKMRHILLYWAAKGVDGFRCDMAEMVPVEFWHWVIRGVRDRYPDLLFLAEVYNPDSYRDYIHQGGFDYLYDKVEMYDTLKRISWGHVSTDEITPIWQRQEGITDRMLRFLENHDEQRIASPYFAGDMRRGIPMMAVASFMHKGAVMVYFGQEVGELGEGFSGFSGEDGRTTIFDYWGVPENQKWVNKGRFDGGGLSEDQKNLRSAYIDILKRVNSHAALREGGFYDLHFYNRNESYIGYSDMIYAFLRHSRDESLLVVVNFGSEEQAVQIKIPEEAWERMSLQKEYVKVSSAVSSTWGSFRVRRAGTIGYDKESELKIAAPPLDYLILRLN